MSKKPRMSAKKFKYGREYAPVKRYEYLCQCENGHLFDYDERVRMEKDGFAPCQGRCPKCLTATFTFTDTRVRPISYYFLG